MKYVAKPVETEAEQFTGDNWEVIDRFVGSHKIDEDAYMQNFIPAWEMWVDIPEGITALIWVEPSKQWAGVKPGDYIVQDADGNFYPCERSIFERKYEPIKSASVITARQIEDTVGRMIQRSSRFK